MFPPPIKNQAVPLSQADRDLLARLRANGDWTRTSIDRTGCSKPHSLTRQKLARLGLIERHPTQRLTWRLTAAGQSVRTSLEAR